jgi:hypothetical protein
LFNKLSIEEIIMAEKSFFRIKVKSSCPYHTVMVKGLGTVTKKWQTKKGNASDYAVYPNLDVQPVVKEGNTFIPAPNADLTAETESELSDSGGSSGSSPAPESEADETATLQNEGLFENVEPDFDAMTVEQLKAYLTESGASSSDLRGAVKSDLIIQANAVWNTQQQSQD